MQKESLSKRLKKSNIIIVTHVYGTGASQDFVRWCNENKTRGLLFIGHPLFFDKNLKGSGYEYYEKGILVKAQYQPLLRIPLFLGYIKDMVMTFVWVWKQHRKWDLYVGSNNLNAYIGILLRKMGMVKKVVYYVIDYNPVRYANGFLNTLYHRLDQYCVRRADETWNMSPRMEQGRKEYFNFTGGHQKTVPVGLWLSDTQKHVKPYEPHTLAFLGHIQQKQGIQHIIDAIPLVLKKIPDFRFVVIGGGAYLPVLQDRVKELHIQKYVTFTGYIKDHSRIDSMLSRCAAGVALYEKKDGDNISFSYFGNPTKIKTYLLAGLPILLSDVPYNAKEIEKEGCGKIISHDSRQIAFEIIRMLKNSRMLIQYRNNVVRYRRQFDWNSIFAYQLQRLL